MACYLTLTPTLHHLPATILPTPLCCSHHLPWFHRYLLSHGRCDFPSGLSQLHLQDSWLTHLCCTHTAHTHAHPCPVLAFDKHPTMHCLAHTLHTRPCAPLHVTPQHHSIFASAHIHPLFGMPPQPRFAASCLVFRHLCARHMPAWSVPFLPALYHSVNYYLCWFVLHMLFRRLTLQCRNRRRLMVNRRRRTWLVLMKAFLLARTNGTTTHPYRTPAPPAFLRLPAYHTPPVGRRITTPRYLGSAVVFIISTPPPHRPHPTLPHIAHPTLRTHTTLPYT